MVRLLSKFIFLQIVLTAILIINGCGFHLVEDNSLKKLPICIQGKNSEFFSKNIKHECNKNSYLLQIKKVSSSQLDITASANNNFKQYQYEQYILFNLYNNKHAPIVLNQIISLNKPLIINNNFILSSTSEKDILKTEMKQQLTKNLRIYLQSKIIKH